MENLKYADNISLITTVYNEAGNIEKFLESYYSQDLYADEFLIVDGGSKDGTSDIINDFSGKYPFLRIKLFIDELYNRKNSTSPIALARNFAIKNCKNDIIAVTDAGCTLHRHWFSQIIQPFADETVDVVSGWYEVKPLNRFQEIYCAMFVPKLETIHEDTFLPSSRSIAFRKKCWTAVGGYPVRDAISGEDTKFDINLRNAGFKFRFAPKAVVFWHAPLTLDKAKKQHYSYGFGDGVYRLFLWHYIKRILKTLLPFELIFANNRKEKWILVLYMVAGYIKGYFSVPVRSFLLTVGAEDKSSTNSSMKRERILYIMNESWYWIKQRPHFIAEYLAKESSTYQIPNTKHQILNTKYQILIDVYCEKRYTKLVDNPVPEGVRVNEIFKLPLTNNPVIKQLNRLLLKEVLFRSKFKNASRDYDLVWLSSPKHYEYIKPYIKDNIPVVYDCMDDILEFGGSRVSKKILQGHFDTEKELYIRSNIVFCSSSALKENLVSRYGNKENVIVINNAIHQIPNTEYRIPNTEYQIPNKLSRLFDHPFKKICYIGSISEWFDFDILISALKENPGVMAVIIGPSDVKIPTAERLHYHPPVNHGIVMEIMKKSDALIMPFRVTPLVMAVNPVKLYEYIYAEVPSVSVAYPESEKFEDFVYLYRTHDEFRNYIRRIQESRLPLKQPKGSGVSFALQNTWVQRVQEILFYLKEII